jgi:DNA end-binding protein Ku
MMAQGYKSAISFGLVYIPVTLHACIKNKDIGFNMLYKKTKERIKYKKTCDNCPANLSMDDIVKGYEYEKGKYIILTDKELEKIKSDSDKNITIQEFVKLEEIDPIFYDKSYYVVPTGADRAYYLLYKALEKEKKVGIAKTVLGTKENIVALRAINGQLVLNTMHFFDEIQNSPLNIPAPNITENEIKITKNIIDNMTYHFKAENYKNEYQQKLLKAIETKINGEEIQAQKIPRKKNIINLMDALKKTAEFTSKARKNGKAKLNEIGIEEKSDKKGLRDRVVNKKSSGKVIQFKKRA